MNSILTALSAVVHATARVIPFNQKRNKDAVQSFTDTDTSDSKASYFDINDSEDDNADETGSLGFLTSRRIPKVSWPRPLGRPTGRLSKPPNPQPEGQPGQPPKKPKPRKRSPQRIYGSSIYSRGSIPRKKGLNWMCYRDVFDVPFEQGDRNKYVCLFDG